MCSKQYGPIREFDALLRPLQIRTIAGLEKRTDYHQGLGFSRHRLFASAPVERSKEFPAPQGKLKAHAEFPSLERDCE
jgi:hypothetical protein